MPSPAEGLVGSGVAGWLRRFERELAFAWLAGTVLLLAIFAIPLSRDHALSAVQRVADYYDARWTRRLREGERLIDAGQFAAAEVYLERLDRDFPARNVRAGRDKERERVLHLLAQAQEANGRRGRTIDTWRRVIAFDSLNYQNYYGYAKAAERLLSGWAPADEARDGYLGVLRLFPSHLPSVRGYIEYYMARGEFPPVTLAWNQYQDAVLYQSLRVIVGSDSLDVRLPVDGRPHPVDLALPASAQHATELAVSAGGFAFQINGATLQPALVVGAAQRLLPRVLDVGAGTPSGLKLVGPGWLPAADSSRYALTVPQEGAPWSRLQLVVTLFKPVDKSLWKKIQKAYRDQLLYAALDSMTTRSVIFPDAAAADSVMARLEWAREGNLQDSNE